MKERRSTTTPRPIWMMRKTSRYFHRPTCSLFPSVSVNLSSYYPPSPPLPDLAMAANWPPGAQHSRAKCCPSLGPAPQRWSRSLPPAAPFHFYRICLVPPLPRKTRAFVDIHSTHDQHSAATQSPRAHRQVPPSGPRNLLRRLRQQAVPTFPNSLQFTCPVPYSMSVCFSC